MRTRVSAGITINTRIIIGNNNTIIMNSGMPFMNQNWSLWRMSASPFTLRLVAIYEPKLKLVKDERRTIHPSACSQLWTKTGVCEGWAPHHSPLGLWPFMNPNWSLWRMSAAPFTPRPLASYEAKLEFVKDERRTIHPSAFSQLWTKTGVCEGWDPHPSSPSRVKKSALILVPVPIYVSVSVSASVSVLVLKLY